MSKKNMRTYVEVSLPAIIHNIQQVKKRVPEDVKVMAVIKSDGYGHGAVEVGTALRNSVDYFGVAAIEEAIELRCAGLMLPILILGYTMHGKYDDVVRHDVAQTIYNFEDARLLSEMAGMCRKIAKVHIAVDTGMTRIGYVPNAASVEEIKRISELPYVEIEGIFTHMSCADEKDKNHARMQMQKFQNFIHLLENNDVQIPVKHICNSAGIMDFEGPYYDMVRSGIITYGLYPSEEVNKSNINLRPAISWYAHVVHVKTAMAGEGVSYGATYVTKRPTKIATISVGYGDGYPRSLSNKGCVLIHGKRVPIIGRVCMDQLMVDVTELADVKVEDLVTLVGIDGEEQITVEEIANLSGSFNYEFICDIGKRVQRVYQN